MVFINTSSSVGAIVVAFTNNVTGSLFLTLLMIVIVLTLFASIFRIPLEISATVILPLLLAYMAYSSEFMVVGGVMLIYLAVIFAKMFFLNR